MKTHRKTLIALLIFCMAIHLVPSIVFAVTEPTAAERETNMTEPSGSATEQASEEECPEGSADKDMPAEEKRADDDPDGKTEGSEIESKYREEQTPDSISADSQDLKETEPEADPAAPEGLMLKKAPMRATAGSEQINYTASRPKSSIPVIFRATINGKQYKGTCNECGIAWSSSGTMTVVVLGKDDLRRKVAYKYGSWLEVEERNYSMGGVYRGICLEAMLQYARAWMDDKKSGGSGNRTAVVSHWRKSSSNGGNGWSASTCTKITDAVKALDGKTAADLGIPNSFRAYHGIVENVKNSEGRTFGQDPVFWGTLVTGGISIKKVPESGREDYVAAHPEEFDLTGAKYQLWTDAACTVKATDINWNDAVLTTKADGTTNELTMEVGDYYLTEIQKPAKGYGLDTDKVTGEAAIHKETIKENKTTVAVYAEPVEISKVRVKKVDASGKALANARLQIYEGDAAAGPEWTSSGSDHEVTGLTSGKTYTLRELAAPAGYDIADDVSFRVGTAETTVVTMKNIPVTVTTTAVSKATNKHIGQKKAGEVIMDTVHMTGLVRGRKYRLDAQLMNKDTGNAIRGASASKEFTASASDMDMVMEISTDPGKLPEGAGVVVFETLYRTSKIHSESVPVELKRHHDLNDTEQTVTYPSIFTEASMQNHNNEVKDVIHYKNLLPNMKYVFKGWLVDTATGTKVPDSDSRKEMDIGSDTSGKTEMILKTGKYDSMNGHSMTAFEELYIVDNVSGSEKEILIAEHKDKNDSKQTVGVFQDLKIKKIVTGNLGDITKKFEFTAEFNGLVPGEAYSMEGDDEKTFMADSSGRASVPLLLKGGQEAMVRDLPKGATYKVTEAASDHIAGYKMYSEDMAEKGAKIVKAEDSNGSEEAKSLATATETVDLFDGTVVILFENNRDLAAITGYAGIDYRVYAAVLAVLTAGTAFIVISGKKRRGRCA